MAVIVGSKCEEGRKDLVELIRGNAINKASVSFKTQELGSTCMLCLESIRGKVAEVTVVNRESGTEIKETYNLHSRCYGEAKNYRG